MAGESPGKSEQRKSSGETAGSEPRDARDARDPRLAVFREGPAAPRGASGASPDTDEGSSGDAPVTHEAAAGGADQPTATFRTRPRGTELPDAGDPSSEPEAESPSAEEEPSADGTRNEASGASEASGADGKTGAAGDSAPPEPGDSRLRAAVAAWVATSDDETPAEAGTRADEASADTADEDAADPAPTPEAESSAPDAEPTADTAANAVPSPASAKKPAPAEANLAEATNGPAPADRSAKAASASVPGKKPAPAEGEPADAPDASATAGREAKAAPASVPGKKPAPAEGEPAEAPDAPVPADRAAKAASASVPEKKPAAAEGEPAEVPDASATAGRDAKAAPASVPGKKPAPAEGEPAEAPDAPVPADRAAKTASMPEKKPAPVEAEPTEAPDTPVPADRAAKAAAASVPGKKPVPVEGEPAEAPDAPGTADVDAKAASASVPAKKKAALGADADDAAGAESAEDPDASGTADADVKADPASVSAKTSATADAAKAEGEGESAGAPDTGDAAASGAAKKSVPGAGAGKGAGEEDGESSGGVDQATAVFTTMRRPATSEVDQPTAMLKLPSDQQLKPTGAGAAKSSPLPRPESDAERTSKFVPLKPDDVRTPRPPRKPGETAAQPGAAQPRPVPPPPGPGLPETERTRQQPLPPKPPLDLLAELTNKPAPPETPVRTTVRRFKIWTPLVLLLLLIFAVVQFVRPLPDPKLTLSAKPTYTFGGGTTEMPWSGEGQSAIEIEGVGSMGTEGPQKPAPIASMAKAMTAYVILKDHPLKGKETGPKIKVDRQGEEDAGKGDESTAQIKEGQEYTQRQMLMMLMIPSGNNVARLLGRWDAGSEDKFLEKMNAAAKDLGMTNSTYTDSSGFDKGTVSTPLDQIKLGRALMKNDVFREIVDMPQVDIPGLPGRIYNNNNILLKPGVNGIKTGSTTPAGGNLLFTASTVVDGETHRIIGAVMNQQTGDQLGKKLQRAIDQSLKLIQKAQDAATSAQVVKKGDVVGYVDDGLGGQTPVVATKDLKAIGWPGLKVELGLGAQAGKPVPHAGKAGDVVGEITVGTGPGKQSAPVALQSDLAEPGFGAKLKRVG